MILNRLKQEATRLGACAKLDGANDYMALSRLLFSPQGREFCEKHNFPSLTMFQQMKPYITEGMGVFVDFGRVCRSNDKDIALIGDSCGELVFDENKTVHTIILMHGAKAVITASNYAVLLIVRVGNCEVIINKDNTVKVL